MRIWQWIRRGLVLCFPLNEDLMQAMVFSVPAMVVLHPAVLWEPVVVWCPVVVDSPLRVAEVELQD
ncbi:hypothetical protein DPMN_152024 [Dreissena polymorpha]|uniref:Uncharacterized protein n=1 Tax=Dreissena polymorpha TaxID=45954 RepID=A0A9D4J4T3_DREPO|nr:hypothetical protein DPMN_152024 [Dreissena polymorpha]